MNTRASIILFVATLAQIADAKLSYFSLWSLEAGGDPSIARGWNNFIFTSTNVDDLATFAKGGVGPNLLQVTGVFFTNKAIRPDAEARWNATFATLKPLIASGAAMGVFLGDELAWSCIPVADIEKAAAIARRDLGPDGIIYQNEAYPPLLYPNDNGLWAWTCGKDSPAIRGGYPRVPANLSWFSMDYYPDEGTFDGVKKMYNESIFPRMAKDTQGLFVPPAYGAGGNAHLANELCCNAGTRDGANPPCHGNCTKPMVQWALDSYNWARSEPRMVGLNPWHWSGGFAPNAKFEPGLVGLPAVVQETWKKIGTEIVSGRLGDVESPW